jgi:hypothetical protein
LRLRFVFLFLFRRRFVRFRLPPTVGAGVSIGGGDSSAFTSGGDSSFFGDSASSSFAGDSVGEVKYPDELDRFPLVQNHL